MRESDLLTHIYTRSADLTAAFGDVLVGPGDDCAVVRTPSGDQLLIGVDQLVVGRHVEASLLDTPEDLDLVARKAIARSVSDIAAMGGRPCWGLATGLLPRNFTHADALFDAMAKWARHWNCPLIGGDIAVGDGPASLTVTVAGRTEPGTQPLLRSTAKPGDELWLTGQVGGSLQSGWHLRFEPRLAAGLAAAASGNITACIDLSDGLGRDAARIGAASNAVLEINAATLPISHRCRDWREAVAAGEDYELLLCARPGREPFQAEPRLIGPIGRVRPCTPDEQPGCRIIDAHGALHDAGNLGWDHA